MVLWSRQATKVAPTPAPRQATKVAPTPAPRQATKEAPKPAEKPQQTAKEGANKSTTPEDKAPQKETPKPETNRSEQPGDENEGYATLNEMQASMGQDQANKSQQKPEETDNRPAVPNRARSKSEETDNRPAVPNRARSKSEGTDNRPAPSESIAGGTRSTGNTETNNQPKPSATNKTTDSDQNGTKKQKESGNNSEEKGIQDKLVTTHKKPWKANKSTDSDQNSTKKQKESGNNREEKGFLDKVKGFFKPNNKRQKESSKKKPDTKKELKANAKVDKILELQAKMALEIASNQVGSAVEKLNKLPADTDLQTQFRQLATGSGELRNLVTHLASLVNNSVPGSELHKAAKAVYDAEINGISFSQWGTKEGPAREFIQHASKEQLSATLAQLKALASDPHLAKALADIKSGNNNANPEAVETPKNKPTATEEKAAQKEDQDLEARTLEQQKDEGDGYAPLDEYQGNKKPAKPKDEITDDKDIYSKVPKAFIDARTARKNQDNNSTQGNDQQQANKPQQKPEEAENIPAIPDRAGSKSEGTDNRPATPEDKAPQKETPKPEANKPEQPGDNKDGSGAATRPTPAPRQATKVAPTPAPRQATKVAPTPAPRQATKEAPKPAEKPQQTAEEGANKPATPEDKAPSEETPKPETNKPEQPGDENEGYATLNEMQASMGQDQANKSQQKPEETDNRPAVPNRARSKSEGTDNRPAPSESIAGGTRSTGNTETNNQPKPSATNKTTDSDQNGTKKQKESGNNSEEKGIQDKLVTTHKKPWKANKSTDSDQNSTKKQKESGNNREEKGFLDKVKGFFKPNNKRQKESSKKKPDTKKELKANAKVDKILELQAKMALEIASNQVGSAVEKLNKLPADTDLQTQFRQLATGSGELRNLVTHLASLVNNSVPGSELHKAAKAVYDAEINGISFSQWGTKEGPAREFIQHASKEQLSATLAQLKALASDPHLAKALADIKSGNNNANPEAVETPKNKPTATEEKAAQKEDQDLEARTLEQQKDEGDGYAPLDEYQGNKKPAKPKDEITDDKDIYSKVPKAFIDARTARKNQDNNSTQGNDQQQANKPQQKPEEAENIPPAIPDRAGSKSEGTDNRPATPEDKAPQKETPKPEANKPEQPGDNKDGSGAATRPTPAPRQATKVAPTPAPKPAKQPQQTAEETAKRPLKRQGAIKSKTNVNKPETEGGAHSTGDTATNNQPKPAQKPPIAPKPAQKPPIAPKPAQKPPIAPKPVENLQQKAAKATNKPADNSKQTAVKDTSGPDAETPPPLPARPNKVMRPEEVLERLNKTNPKAVCAHGTLCGILGEIAQNHTLTENDYKNAMHKLLSHTRDSGYPSGNGEKVEVQSLPKSKSDEVWMHEFNGKKLNNFSGRTANGFHTKMPFGKYVVNVESQTTRRGHVMFVKKEKTPDGFSIKLGGSWTFTKDPTGQKRPYHIIDEAKFNTDGSYRNNEYSLGVNKFFSKEYKLRNVYNMSSAHKSDIFKSNNKPVKKTQKNKKINQKSKENNQVSDDKTPKKGLLNKIANFFRSKSKSNKKSGETAPRPAAPSRARSKIEGAHKPTPAPRKTTKEAPKPAQKPPVVAPKPAQKPPVAPKPVENLQQKAAKATNKPADNSEQTTVKNTSGPDTETPPPPLPAKGVLPEGHKKLTTFGPEGTAEAIKAIIKARGERDRKASGNNSEEKGIQDKLGTTHKEPSATNKSTDSDQNGTENQIKKPEVSKGEDDKQLMNEKDVFKKLTDENPDATCGHGAACGLLREMAKENHLTVGDFKSAMDKIDGASHATDYHHSDTEGPVKLKGVDAERTDIWKEFLGGKQLNQFNGKNAKDLQTKLGFGLYVVSLDSTNGSTGHLAYLKKEKTKDGFNIKITKWNLKNGNNGQKRTDHHIEILKFRADGSYMGANVGTTQVGKFFNSEYKVRNIFDMSSMPKKAGSLANKTDSARNKLSENKKNLNLQLGVPDKAAAMSVKAGTENAHKSDKKTNLGRQETKANKPKGILANKSGTEKNSKQQKKLRFADTNEIKFFDKNSNESSKPKLIPAERGEAGTENAHKSDKKTNLGRQKTEANKPKGILANKSGTEKNSKQQKKLRFADTNEIKFFDKNSNESSKPQLIPAENSQQPAEEGANKPTTPEEKAAQKEDKDLEARILEQKKAEIDGYDSLGGMKDAVAQHRAKNSQQPAEEGANKPTTPEEKAAQKEDKDLEARILEQKKAEIDGYDSLGGMKDAVAQHRAKNSQQPAEEGANKPTTPEEKAAQKEDKDLEARILEQKKAEIDGYDSLGGMKDAVAQHRAKNSQQPAEEGANKPTTPEEKAAQKEAARILEQKKAEIDGYAFSGRNERCCGPASS